MSLLTTHVGSYPKPPALQKARTRFSRGEIAYEELHRLEERATRDWVEFQESIGLDILVDGEQYRGDMATYFAEHLEGTAISGLVRSYGNRYYKKPIVTGALRRTGPITVEWWRTVQEWTDRPVKGMLTGPYTMMDWSFDEHYGSRRETALAFARVLRDEARDLASAGASWIQIDEPALSARADELPLVVEALGIVTEGLPAKTITHTCFGNYAQLYPDLLKLPVDQIDLEMSNSGLDMIALFRKYPFTKEIAFGVIDVHTHVVESKDLVKERIRRALEVVPPERLYIDPDCGLKTRTVDEAKAKMTVMVEAAREVRAEIGAKG
ncbi:MAG TPA: methionine synthase [Thermoplasmata archaeon]|nr:methionine synthase [Thermoplasmata archaeon]